MLARIRRSGQEEDQGFTLIELLVVMIIIGILAAVAIPVYLSQKQKANDAAIKSDLTTIAQLVETAAVESQTYPEVTAYTTDNDALKAVPGLGDAKVSKDVLVQYKSSGTGFCLIGSHPSSSATGGSGGVFFWYSSLTGGLSSTASATAPTDSGCAVSTSSRTSRAPVTTPTSRSGATI